MTKKLYLENSYVKEFSAKVTQIRGNKVVLDQTHFFIQGAGQSGDSGELNGIKVIDVQKGGYHILAKPPTFAVGDTVTGKIDWKKRYKTMRLHSGAHFTEHFIHKLLGKKTVLKTNVNQKRDFSDYKMPMPTKEEQEEIERMANELIAGNHDIQIWMDEKGYRHWRCMEVEMGCTGTHVKNTQEIGRICLAFEEKDPGIVRVMTMLME